MFYQIAISLISSLLLKMALYVLGYWVGIHFYSMVPQFSTVYFVFSQIWNKHLYRLRSLSRYHFNI